MGSHGGNGATEEKALAGFLFSLLVGGYDDCLCARDAFPLEGNLRRGQEEVGVGGDADALHLLEQGRFCSAICVSLFTGYAGAGHKVLLRMLLALLRIKWPRFDSFPPLVFIFVQRPGSVGYASALSSSKSGFSRGTNSLSLKLA